MKGKRRVGDGAERISESGKKWGSAALRFLFSPLVSSIRRDWKSLSNARRAKTTEQKDLKSNTIDGTHHMKSHWAWAQGTSGPIPLSLLHLFLEEMYN